MRCISSLIHTLSLICTSLKISRGSEVRLECFRLTNIGYVAYLVCTVTVPEAHPPLSNKNFPGLLVNLEQVSWSISRNGWEIWCNLRATLGNIVGTYRDDTSIHSVLNELSFLPTDALNALMRIGLND